MKICSKCGKDESQTGFSPKRFTECRKCSNIRRNKFYADNLESERKVRRDFYHSKLKDRVCRTCHETKKTSEFKGKVLVCKACQELIQERIHAPKKERVKKIKEIKPKIEKLKEIKQNVIVEPVKPKKDKNPIKCVELKSKSLSKTYLQNRPDMMRRIKEHYNL